MAQPLRWLLPSLCLLLVVVYALKPSIAADLWWQLKTGELIWTTGRVPHSDFFSHTSAGHPWQVQEWLSEVIFYGLFHGLSADALVAYKALGPLLVFALVLWRCWRRCGRWGLSAAVTALSVLVAGPWLDVRPQILTYFLLAVTLLILEQWQRGIGRRAIWLLPLITLLWVNLHGGFMVMFALLGVEIAGAVCDLVAGTGSARRLRTLIAVALLSALCGLVNPNGAEAYRYAFLLLRHNDMVNYIQEWWSPTVRDEYEKPLGYLILLLAFSGVLARRNQPRDLLLLGGLLHAALFSHRHVPLFAIACAPVIAERLGQRLRDIQRWLLEHRWSYRVCSTVAAGLLTVLMTGWLAREVGRAELVTAVVATLRGEPRGSWFARCAGVSTFPVQACEFLRAQPAGGRLFNQYNWGGYCAWRLWPKYHVFIDGRAEVYFGTSYWDYKAIADVAPGWQDKMRHWGVDTVLVDHYSMLAQVLAQEPGWRQIYQDNQAEVFRRVGAAEARNAALPQRTGEASS
jgi:hypothetical protein